MASSSLFIKRSIKSVASVAKTGTGLPRTAPDAVNILAYHRVVADITKAEEDAFYGIVVSSGTFRRHCEMLRETYRVVSLETAGRFLAGQEESSRPLAAITFDDGYLDFYEEAFPILSELGMPATVFLPVNFIGSSVPLAHDRIFWLLKQACKSSIPITGSLLRAGVVKDLRTENVNERSYRKLVDEIVYLPAGPRDRFIAELESELGEFESYPREYRLLDWAMINEMARKGIDFGGHTANHVILPFEDDDAMDEEIVESKSKLESRINKEVTSFAYPNGEFNPGIRNLVARAGYKIAVTTEKKINRPGADLLALGRTSLCEESTRGLWGTYSPGVASLRLGI